VPVFALANAGVVVSADGLRDAVRSPVTWGVVVGLVIGKPLGVVLATTLAGRAGLDVSAVAPRRRLAGLGATAGIGFTVALFVTELAFTDESTRADAKLGVLAASLVAAALAWALLRRGGAQAEGVGLGVSP
jgi:Na+/H+ antiporter NhaA